MCPAYHEHLGLRFICCICTTRRGPWGSSGKKNRRLLLHSASPTMSSAAGAGEPSSSSRPVRVNDAAPTYRLCVVSYSTDASPNVSSSQGKEREEGTDVSNRKVEDEGDRSAIFSRLRPTPSSFRPPLPMQSSRHGSRVLAVDAVARAEEEGRCMEDGGFQSADCCIWRRN